MTLQDQILSDGRTVKNTLEHLIAKHMPTAAVASGWVSEVEVDVAAAVEAHPHQTVRAWTLANGADAMTSLGLGRVREFCAAHGLPTSDLFVKAYRVQLLTAALREESAKRA